MSNVAVLLRGRGKWNSNQTCQRLKLSGLARSIDRLVVPSALKVTQIVVSS